MEATTKGAFAMAHEQFCHIWQLTKRGELESLDSAGKYLSQVMLEHPQYHHLWETPCSLARNHGEITPHLHLAIQATILGQIESREPPETVKAYEALLGAGVALREARHALGRVIAEAVWVARRSEAKMQPAYEELYLRKLRRIARHPLRVLNEQIQQLRRSTS